MATAKGPATPSSFDEISQEQLAIYAHELHDFYQRTRELRARLTEREQQIEEKTRQVTELNRMLQVHAQEWHQLAETYRAIVHEIKHGFQQGGMSDSSGLDRLLAGIPAAGDHERPFRSAR